MEYGDYLKKLSKYAPLLSSDFLLNPASNLYIIYIYIFFFFAFLKDWRMGGPCNLASSSRLGTFLKAIKFLIIFLSMQQLLINIIVFCS
jgi:hypothetical protein